VVFVFALFVTRNGAIHVLLSRLAIDGSVSMLYTVGASVAAMKKTCG